MSALDEWRRELERTGYDALDPMAIHRALAKGRVDLLTDPTTRNAYVAFPACCEGLMGPKPTVMFSIAKPISRYPHDRDVVKGHFGLDDVMPHTVNFGSIHHDFILDEETAHDLCFALNLGRARRYGRSD